MLKSPGQILKMNFFLILLVCFSLIGAHVTMANAEPVVEVSCTLVNTQQAFLTRSSTEVMLGTILTTFIARRDFTMMALSSVWVELRT